MPLDPKLYEVVPSSPWPYATVAAHMTVWGYEPVGDHSEAAIRNFNGFLRWERIDPRTGQKKAWVITTPKWRVHNGKDEPVWPSAVIVEAMVAQEVFQRTGRTDGNGGGKSIEVLTSLKPR